MAIVELVMPKLGESIMEATILKWHKQPGDAVNMDETVLDIATDKVDSEVPSTAAGVISEILFNVDDVVPVGAVIARIKTDAAETVLMPGSAPQPKVEIQQPQYETVVEVVSSQPSSFSNQPSSSNGNRFYSPLVLNIAASEGVSMSELENIPGTGNEGRVTKKDILQFVSERKSGARRRESGVGSQESGVGNQRQGFYREQEMTVIKETAPHTSSNSQLTTYTGNELHRRR